MVAWEVGGDVATPVSLEPLESLDDYGSDARWILELPESCGPNRWARVFHGDRFESLELALADLRAGWVMVAQAQAGRAGTKKSPAAILGV